MTTPPVIEFIKFLDIASKTLAMYSLTHPQAQQIVDRTLGLLSHVLEGRESLTISEAEGNLLVEGTLVPKDSRAIDHLSRNLLGKSIHSVTFLQGLSREDFVILLTQLNLKPQRVQHLGGFAKIMEEAGVRTILINKVKYGIISEGQTSGAAGIDQGLLSEMLLAMQAAISGTENAKVTAANIEKSFDEKTTANPADLLMRVFHTIVQRAPQAVQESEVEETMKDRFVQLYRSFSPTMQAKLLLNAILKGSSFEDPYNDFYRKLSPEEFERALLHLLDEPLPAAEIKQFVEKLQSDDTVSVPESVQKKIEEKGLIEKEPAPELPLYEDLLKKANLSEEDILKTPAALSEALSGGELAEADRLSKRLFSYLGSGSSEQKIATIKTIPSIVEILSRNERWKNVEFSLSFLISTCFRKETDPGVLMVFLSVLVQNFLKANETGNQSACQEILNTIRSQTSRSEDLRLCLAELVRAKIDRILPHLREATPGTEIILDLLRTTGQKGAELLIDLLAEEEDQKVRSRLIQSIATIPAEDLLPVMNQRIADPAWFVVRNMVTILGKMTRPEIPDLFLQAANHPDPRVAKELVKVLYKTAPKTSGKFILELLQHPDKSVRVQAIHLAGLHQIDAAVPALMSIIHGVSPAETDLRAQALQTLAKMKITDASPAAIMILERKSSGKQDVAERNAAVRLLGELYRNEAQFILQKVAQSDANAETRGLAATYLL